MGSGSLKSALLGAARLRRRRIELELLELDEDGNPINGSAAEIVQVLVRELRSDELLAYVKAARDDVTRARALLLASVVLDDDGEPLFSSADEALPLAQSLAFGPQVKKIQDQVDAWIEGTFEKEANGSGPLP